MCESAWKENMHWPPSKPKVKKCVIISVEYEPHGNDSHVSDRICTKTCLVVVQASTNTGADDQLDPIDHVVAQPWRSMDEGSTYAAENLHMFVSHHDDISKCISIIRTLIDEKEIRLAK